jgi:hypothetical protein
MATRPWVPLVTRWAIQALVSSGFGALFAYQLLDAKPDSTVGVLTCFVGILLPVHQLRAVVASVMRRQLRVFTDPDRDSEGG